MKLYTEEDMRNCFTAGWDFASHYELEFVKDAVKYDEWITRLEPNTRIEELEADCIKAKNMIRDLRDSDVHDCPADINDECTCEEFDRIIDVLSD